MTRRLHPTELFAFLDDLHRVSTGSRVDVHHIVTVELWSHAEILQHGKTQVWNRRSRSRQAQVSDTDALVWREPHTSEGGAGNENSGHPVGPSHLHAVVPPRKNGRPRIVIGEDSGGPGLAVGMVDFALLCFNESKLSAEVCLLVSLRSLLPVTTSRPELV